MAKHNKVRYKSKGNPFATIALTGKIFLRHRDDELLQQAEKGDLLIFLSTDTIAYNTQVGNYDAMGLEGYLKADVYDGKRWNPLSLEEFFPGREYYFGKRERPIDTFRLCQGTLQDARGVELMRTYREHYVKAPIAAAGNAGEE